MFRKILAAAALTACVAATPVAAANFTVIYQGVIDAGAVNDLGYFGGGNLAGKAFTATFYVNTTPLPGSSFQQDIGGMYPDAQLTGTNASSPVKGRISVGGVEASLDSNNVLQYTENGDLFSFGNLPYSTQDSIAIQDFSVETISYLGGPDYLYLSYAFYGLMESFNGLINGGDLYSLPSLTAGPDAAFQFEFDAYKSIYSTDLRYSYCCSEVTRFTGTVNSVTVAVPEPATWALMIGGFGLAGAQLRRRRRMIAAA